ncbi:hypothetical protein [Actinoplanes sp. RD1]|uniref:hypothetical protein n=1 Tax=Actinoplanes sp. RD1 TaxID=3064538 RepID=UPI002740B36F|nr:hypothetical protein [Actinoplanes sp. RD1]
MGTHGWAYPFEQYSWETIDVFLGGMADRYAEFQHMSDIVTSVVASGRTGALAACTSMHDLIVVATPIPEPPYGVVAVRAPGSLREPADGMVRIEHHAVTGHDEVIERPVADAVPLFWRFMIEKFGVGPGPR